MSEAAMTPEQSGNDSVRPSISLDDASEIDFYDPNEDTNEDEQPEQSETETDEATDGQESEEIDATAGDDDETEAEETGEEDEASTPEPGDDVSVTVNGEKLTLNELKRGYLREGDYTRKTQVISQKEKNLDALSARVTRSVNAIAEFLVQQLPAPPDFALSQTDPMAFMRQKAIYEAATQSLNDLLAKAGEVKEVGNTLTAEKRTELLQSENAKLAEAFPQTATAEGRQKFFETAASAAAEMGWSKDEIGQVTDHRMFKLAHYAALGLAAEKAKAKAKQKVQNVPPVTPQKRPQGANAAKVAKNREAMKRLARTGSIEDALAIDFD